MGLGGRLVTGKSTAWEARARHILESVDKPIAEASGLPNEVYVDPSFAQDERDQLLARTWTCVGVGAHVPRPGDVRPVRILGLPLLLVRDLKGEIRVFHNVCSHRGAELVTTPCSVKRRLTCPYHSWTYDLEGKLCATPSVGGPGQNDCSGFDRAKHGLKALRTAVWFDVVFVNISGDAPSFEDHIEPLAERWQGFDPSLLRHGGADSSLLFEVGCNWKLAVENYCEAYHLPWVHPGLNAYSRLEDHYDIALEGRFAGQGSRVYAPRLSDDGAQFPRFPDLPEPWQAGAEYVALFPNVMLGIHADHLFVVYLEPVSVDRTVEYFEIYYVGEAALGDDYAALRQANARGWRAIFNEDQDIVERMQRGRASPAFQGGVFSPAMDGPTHCFHKWAARALAEGVRSEQGLGLVEGTAAGPPRL
jgi:choline monooxygenase